MESMGSGRDLRLDEREQPDLSAGERGPGCRAAAVRALALAAALLLASACAVGSAGYDEQGKPYAWGLAVLHAQIEACPPEDDEGCAKVDAQGLSKNASDVVRSEGFLSGAWSVTKWVAGKALGWLW